MRFTNVHILSGPFTALLSPSAPCMPSLHVVLGTAGRSGARSVDAFPPVTLTLTLTLILTLTVAPQAEVVQDLLKHLKRYRLRSKISLDNVSDEFTVCTGPADFKTDPAVVVGGIDARFHQATAAAAAVAAVPGGGLVRAVVEKKDASNLAGTSAEWEWFRAWHGLGEGTVDMQAGKSLPFESNLDYLGGVSFTKGCYLGQELTARTHHTGVTRKRLLPVDVSLCGEWQFAEGAPASGDAILSDTGKVAGRVRSVVPAVGSAQDGCALVVMRLSYLDNDAAGSVAVVANGDSSSMKPRTPGWWPVPAAEPPAENAE
jgi:folate-binding protein YgfZ